MPLRNDASRFGLVAVTLHWFTALAVVGLFSLGLWMTGLTYYDPWYHQGPWWHKGFGITLLFLVILRLLWRFGNPPPPPLSTHAPWERAGAKVAHALLYLLLFAVIASGYLISTADGRGVEVFGLFEVPALISDVDRQEEMAGQAHFVLACGLIGLASFHALAALKHHFLDKDRTLLRMLGR